MQKTYSRVDYSNEKLIKLTFLITRKENISPESFENEWFQVRTMENTPTKKVNHVYNSIIPGEQIKIKTDAKMKLTGFEEIWFKNRTDAYYYLKYIAKQFNNHIRVRNILDIEHSIALVGDCYSIIESPARSAESVVKIIILNSRKPNMSFKEFSDYWINTHGNLVRKAPGAKDKHHRIEYCPVGHIITYSSSKPSIDGLATIIFQSAEDQKSAFEQSYYKEILACDEPNFSASERSFGTMVKEISLM